MIKPCANQSLLLCVEPSVVSSEPAGIHAQEHRASNMLGRDTGKTWEPSGLPPSRRTPGETTWPSVGLKSRWVRTQGGSELRDKNSLLTRLSTPASTSLVPDPQDAMACQPRLESTTAEVGTLELKHKGPRPLHVHSSGFSFQVLNSRRLPLWFRLLASSPSCRLQSGASADMGGLV